MISGLKGGRYLSPNATTGLSQTDGPSPLKEINIEMSLMGNGGLYERKTRLRYYDHD